MKRFGLGYDAFKKANPSVIVHLILGWEQAVLYLELIGADITTQAHIGKLNPFDGGKCRPSGRG
jgi:crotonobetainyl-CoA:carnitine CoA-transferase CaiB-like acyl-CoA transferase